MLSAEKPCDSGSDRNGGDASAAPGEASQSGGVAASPNSLLASLKMERALMERGL